MKSKAIVALLLGLAIPATLFSQQAGAGRAGHRGISPLGASHGVMGTVQESGADHFIIETYLGERYRIRFGTDTRFVKMTAAAGPRGNGAPQGDQGQPESRTPPATIQPSEIKPGDDIDVMGSVDAQKKESTATTIVLVPPERARPMKEALAGYGKSWLMGKVAALDGVQIHLSSQLDSRSYTVVADENIALRKRREPIALTDLQVGDLVRVDGALQDGLFHATTISVMSMPQGGFGRIPHNGPPRPREPQQ